MLTWAANGLQKRSNTSLGLWLGGRIAHLGATRGTEKGDDHDHDQDFLRKDVRHICPEGPARHLDASRQKLTPHCVAAIFDSQLPSPKLSPKMPSQLPLPHKRGLFFLFQSCPAVRVIVRQLSGKNCLAAIFASRHQDASLGPLGGHGPLKICS